MSATVAALMRERVFTTPVIKNVIMKGRGKNAFNVLNFRKSPELRFECSLKDLLSIRGPAGPGQKLQFFTTDEKQLGNLDINLSYGIIIFHR